MTVLKAKKVPKKEFKADDLLLRFCYYYPQYSLYQARKMPYKRIVQFLRVVEHEHAKRMIDFTRAVASPQSSNKNAINELLQEFKNRLSE